MAYTGINRPGVVVGQNKTPDELLNLLFYLLIRQAGGWADCFRHIQRDGLLGDDEGMKGWRAFVETEVADLFTIAEKFCKFFGLDPESVIQLGRERDQEKAAEYLERHPDDTWF